MANEGEAAQQVAPGRMRPGTPVEVRSDYDGSWQEGFVVAATTEDGYVLRRDGDQSRLPELPADRVRRPRRRQTWWV